MKRRLNEIEMKFLKAYAHIAGVQVDSAMDYDDIMDVLTETGSENLGVFLFPQKPFGIYVVDFAIISHRAIIAVEIDGQETHKTKEQRYNDYKRERFLLNQGVIPVRFTASEVFVSPTQCVVEALNINAKLNNQIECIAQQKKVGLCDEQK